MVRSQAGTPSNAVSYQVLADKRHDVHNRQWNRASCSAGNVVVLGPSILGSGVSGAEIFVKDMANSIKAFAVSHWDTSPVTPPYVIPHSSAVCS